MPFKRLDLNRIVEGQDRSDALRDVGTFVATMSINELNQLQGIVNARARVLQAQRRDERSAQSAALLPKLTVGARVSFIGRKRKPRIYGTIVKHLRKRVQVRDEASNVVWRVSPSALTIEAAR